MSLFKKALDAHKKENKLIPFGFDLNIIIYILLGILAFKVIPLIITRFKK